MKNEKDKKKNLIAASNVLEDHFESSKISLILLTIISYFIDCYSYSLARTIQFPFRDIPSCLTDVSPFEFMDSIQDRINDGGW